MRNRIFISLAALGALATTAWAGELVTLRNGFALHCDHHASVAGHMRLYLGAGENNHITSGGTQGFLGGGNGNTLSALYGAIAAGISNTVSGEGGYVAAGGYNNASGVGAVPTYSCGGGGAGGGCSTT